MWTNKGVPFHAKFNMNITYVSPVMWTNFNVAKIHLFSDFLKVANIFKIIRNLGVLLL
jgi:hypothetical protein